MIHEFKWTEATTWLTWYEALATQDEDDPSTHVGQWYLVFGPNRVSSGTDKDILTCPKNWDWV
jgi:hypothetical protein